MGTIKKRGILQFALLNIITFGIYGLIVGNSIGREIDAICSGDEEHEVSYIVAWLLGLITFGLYLEYWWYKQANRLTYNAGRYGIKVRESGLSLLSFRMTGYLAAIISIILLPVYMSMLDSYTTYTYFSTYSALLNMYRYYEIGIPIVLSVLLVVINVIQFLMPSWSVFGYMGLYFLIKNMNRISDAYGSVEALPYDPMGYDYYNAKCNFPMDAAIAQPKIGWEQEERNNDTVALNQGCILGITGCNAAYHFEVKDGEEIMIGKDPNLASVIIDASYKELSRKHCSVRYSAKTREYLVTDYSSNGTFMNGGRRLATRVTTSVPAGTEITLGTSDNKFRLE